MSTNKFVPKEDVTRRLPDGRNIMLWPAGRPMTIERARSFGLIEADAPKPIAPSEVKGPAEEEDEAEDAEDGPVSATDSAIKLAVENGVDLADVVGTGADGKIIKADVEAHLK